MANTRNPAAVQKERIVDAAMRLIEKNGFDGLQWRAIGNELDVQHNSVKHHFKTKVQLQRAVMRAAVRTKRLRVIAWGLMHKDPTVLKAPSELLDAARSAI